MAADTVAIAIIGSANGVARYKQMDGTDKNDLRQIVSWSFSAARLIAERFYRGR